MPDPFRQQKISNWAAEFASGDTARRLFVHAQEYAESIAQTFLESACAASDHEPEDLTTQDARTGLLRGVARLALPAEASEAATEICAVLLEQLQAEGRVGNGRSLAQTLRACREAYEAARTSPSPAALPAAKKPKPIVRPGSKLGPNDPCPCGSGRKYKKCCKRMFGGA